MEKKVIKIKETDNWPNTTRLEMIERSEVYDKPVLYQYGYYDGYQKCYKRLKADNEVLLNALKVCGKMLDEKKRKVNARLTSYEWEIYSTVLKAIKQVESK